MTATEQRKLIIDRLKSNYDNTSKTIDKRVQNLKMYISIYVILSLISITILLTAIIGQLFNPSFFATTNLGLFGLLSVGFTIRLPKDTAELKLLKHYKNLEETESTQQLPNKANTELIDIVKNQNNLFRNYWILIILALLIIGLGIFQMASNHSKLSWELMKIPLVVFYSIIVFNVLKTNREINKNIIHFSTNL